jgi:hypothetical protein
LAGARMMMMMMMMMTMTTIERRAQRAEGV